MFTSKNPATGEMLVEFPELTPEALEQKLAIAHEAFLQWKETSFAYRAERMKQLAAILKEDARRLGEMMTREMGKPIKQAVAEAEKCAWVCEYYAEHAEKILGVESIASDASDSYVRFDPLGSVLAVMPWNFPFWQVFRFAAPAIMAGNVGLLKHASNVPQCAIEIEKVFVRAGFPEGVFQNLLIRSGAVETVLRDPRVAAATLTGSEAAGQSVASIAGSEIKKTVMELGGSDPFIILADADVEQAANVAVNARLQNNGQSCIAAKRFIVVKEIASHFIAMYRSAYEKLIIGDPMNEATNIGPLATESILLDLEKQVTESVKLGAKVEIGGKRYQYPAPRRGGSGRGLNEASINESENFRGYFYAPTILSNVQPGMPAYHEELFGPVASVIMATDANDAIRIANDSPFGLGASLWTKDLILAKKLAAQLESGGVFINGMVKSDPRLPFGGIKRSGFGRELGAYGIKEFVNVKTVWIK